MYYVNGGVIVKGLKKEHKEFLVEAEIESCEKMKKLEIGKGGAVEKVVKILEQKKLITRE